MEKIMKIFAAAAALSITTLSFAQNCEYSLVRGNEKGTVQWKESHNGGITTLEIIQSSQHTVQTIGADLKNTSWKVQNASLGADYTVTRSGDTYTVKGTLKGKPISRTMKSKGYPWYQCIAYCSGLLLKNGTTSVIYESIRPSNADIYTMKITLEGDAKVGDIPVKEVKCSAAGGLAGALWSCRYWFDGKGRFIRYRGVEGGPGTPATEWTLKK